MNQPDHTHDHAAATEEIARLKLEAGTWRMRAEVRGQRVAELEAERDSLTATMLELLEILRQWEPDHSSGKDRQRIVQAMYQIGVLRAPSETVAAMKVSAGEAAPTPQNSQDNPVRGSHINGNWFHDAGAYARCSWCGRYSDKIEALNKDEWPCECGKLHGWSGSFVAPTADSRWSDLTPNDRVEGRDAALSRRVPSHDGLEGTP